MFRFQSILLLLFTLFNFSFSKVEVPKTDYDVIIVGGGPAGLSTMSALCRVSRRAVLFDTAEYRNNKTRNMHDVIGADGLPPHEFRTAARQMIDKYDLGTFIKQKVVSIAAGSKDGMNFFTATDATGKKYTGRRVVLATGVTDVLPSTPGADDAYGKGMYWCPWCDGFEHRDQSLAVLGPLSDALSSVLEMHNINPDTIVLTNGTDTEAEREIATKRSATWAKQLAAYKVPVINNSITSIQRLRDGGEACSEPSPMAIGKQAQQVIPSRENAGPNGKHYDLFQINFESGLHLERAAILINMPTMQTSTLGKQMKLTIDASDKIVVGPKVNTSMEGVFAVGDCNSEGATNVPHAMYNGKKAGVIIHVQLAKEESLATISKRSLSIINDIQLERITMEKIGNELEKAWERIKAAYA